MHMAGGPFYQYFGSWYVHQMFHWFHMRTFSLQRNFLKGKATKQGKWNSWNVWWEEMEGTKPEQESHSRHILLYSLPRADRSCGCSPVAWTHCTSTAQRCSAQRSESCSWEAKMCRLLCCSLEFIVDFNFHSALCLESGKTDEWGHHVSSFGTTAHPYSDRKTAPQSRADSLLDTQDWRILLHLKLSHPWVERGL
jgi:hypothetical protein